MRPDLVARELIPIDGISQRSRPALMNSDSSAAPIHSVDGLEVTLGTRDGRFHSDARFRLPPPSSGTTSIPDMWGTMARNAYRPDFVGVKIEPGLFTYVPRSDDSSYATNPPTLSVGMQHSETLDPNSNINFTSQYIPQYPEPIPESKARA